MASEIESVSQRPTRLSINRVSSGDATLQNLTLGPSVIVPEYAVGQDDLLETAEALEMAKHRLNQGSSSEGSTSTPATPPETSVTDSFAFAFDIDGVLIRGGKPIPEAVEAIKVLNGQNKYGIKM